MYKASAKQIKLLVKWGQEDKAVKAMYDAGYQPQGHTFAYYSPSQANWSYNIVLCRVNGKLYELLTRSGTVEGGREIYEVNLSFHSKGEA